MIRSIDLCIWDKSLDDWEQKCLDDPYMGSNTCFVVTPGGQLLVNTNMSGLYKLGTCGLERMGKLLLTPIGKSRIFPKFRGLTQRFFRKFFPDTFQNAISGVQPRISKNFKIV